MFSDTLPGLCLIDISLILLLALFHNLFRPLFPISTWSLVTSCNSSTQLQPPKLIRKTNWKHLWGCARPFLKKPFHCLPQIGNVKNQEALATDKVKHCTACKLTDLLLLCYYCDSEKKIVKTWMNMNKTSVVSVISSHLDE